MADLAWSAKEAESFGGEKFNTFLGSEHTYPGRFSLFAVTIKPMRISVKEKNSGIKLGYRAGHQTAMPNRAL
jgi:hypothetical protein